MAFEVEFGRVQTCRCVYDGALEQTVQGEFIVPDYQPEIQRILRCIVQPVIMQKIAAGARATVEGYVQCDVVYLSDGGDRPHSVQYRLPFSRSLELAGETDGLYLISARMKKQYLNCRAVSNRKLEMRGTFSLTATVWSFGDEEYISNIDSDGAKQLRRSFTGLRLAAREERQFTLEDLLALEGEGELSILHTEAMLSVSNAAAQADGISVSGVAAVRVLAAHGENMREYTFSIPFDERIDAALGEVEGARLVTQAQVQSLSLQQDADEPNAAALTLAAVVCVAVFMPCDGEYVADVFSTSCECTAATAAMAVAAQAGQSTAEFQAEGSFAAESGTCLGCILANSTCAAENGVAILRATLVAFYSSDGELSATETPAEFALGALQTQAGFEELEAGLNQLSATAAAGVLTVKISGTLTRASVGTQAVEPVVSAASEPEKVKVRPDAAMIVYYADGGETVWEIAKHYETAPNAIVAANALETQTITERRALLIPILD